MLLGYFFWCYKEVAGPAPMAPAMSWRTRWLLAPRSDVVAAALLGVGDVSKPTQHRLDHAAAGARRRCAGSGARGQDRRRCSAASWSALFALNIAVTGDWNYQGGERKTFYSAGDGTFAGGFPFQTDASTFDSVGMGSDRRRLVRSAGHARRAARSVPATTSATSWSAATPASRSISSRG